MKIRNTLIGAVIRRNFTIPSTTGLSPSLTDTFGRYHNYLRISLTEKCNFRCQYCMPADGITLTARDKLMTLEERKTMLSIFSKLGINKLRFTGGEPTLSKDLVTLIDFASNELNIKSIGITTNGSLLNTRSLGDLKRAGLTSINVSLDSLSPERFATISRRDSKGLSKVLATIYASVSLGLKTKINCVLMRGTNDDELLDFVNLSKEFDIDCRFIELMPFDGNEWSPDKFVSYFEATDRLAQQGVHLRRVSHGKGKATKATDIGITSQILPFSSSLNISESSELEQTHPVVEFDPHDTTKWYTVEKHIGRVGFITSMSSHFCGGCNRLRVTADGKLKVCLFGDEGLSLRDSMRSGMTEEDIVCSIEAAVKRKKEVLGGHDSPQDIANDHNRPMILIGG